MTNTNNYNLILVEGTDKYNPLTQVNPNFENIDGVMKANSIASISTATEIKSGTVHEITRSNPDAAVFRFVATSAWTKGDTIEVDNVQVSTLKTDGTPLETGDYIIGSNVIGILTSTTLTLLVNAKSGDASTLDGHPTSYFATDSDLDAVRVVAEGAANATADNTTAINQLRSDLSDSKKNSFGKSVNIKSYNTSANKYVCPSDGYIMLNCTNSTDDYAMVTLYGNSDNESNWVQLRARSNHNYTSSIYVRKGMRILAETINGAPEILFVPFV